MTILISIIAFILIFSVLILVHEFGHFWMARRAGVRVDEFGFGLPPRIWGKKKGDTLYSVNLIPFGGFVRLFGEDPNEFRALKSKESFLTKGLWDKTKIVCGGVAMNFILAWVLLTFGLIVGIDPLIVTFDKFQEYVQAGSVHMTPGYTVEESSELLGVSKGDRVIEINGEEASGIVDLKAYIEGLEEGFVDVKVRHVNLPEDAEIDGYAPIIGSIDRVHTYAISDLEELEVFTVARIPRLVVSKDSSLGLLQGDQVLRVNEKEVLGQDDFLEFLYSGRLTSIDVLRNGSVYNITHDLSLLRTRVDRILDDAPADTAGVEVGDVFVSINGIDVFDPEEVRDLTLRASSQTGLLKYVFMRGEEQVELEIVPNEDGLIGVALSPITTLNSMDIDFYETLKVSSVLDIDKQQVSVIKAPFSAVAEIGEIGVVTGKMIAEVFAGVFSSGEVPDGVAGPVGIAQMTHMSVQNGFMDVIRFAAILSLSLGVLNILPFPALDGGRLAFILLEAITGKKVAHKFEAMIHAIGFAVLLLLILLITWNDVMRFF
ncbi:hypothetical protein HOG48_05830 [Candidatus Peregrinibacteria bacterium]|jgi:regulator of sigma E protease|nr:hypothetical protein [Candidatus Peregrinibacteria bacterium]